MIMSGMIKYKMVEEWPTGRKEMAWSIIKSVDDQCVMTSHKSWRLSTSKASSISENIWHHIDDARI